MIQDCMMEQEIPQERRSGPEEEMTEERFLKSLYLFMKERGTPIERIPHLGFKQIDMFLMYKTVKELGGYQQVTTQQLWKKVYNILGGNPRSTSAATCTRRHYEKLLLPYECNQTGYRDDMAFQTPRPQKRFHSGYHDFEQEYPRSDKRPDLRHLLAFAQTSPSMFMEHHRQVVGIPLNTPAFFPQGTTSLSTYRALREAAPLHLSLNPSLDPLRMHAAHLHTPPMESASNKQPVNELRLLAKEYRSTVGLEEPLNLSRNQNRLQTLSDTPSSFSLCSKKTPFLNEATTLYTSMSLSTEEKEETLENTHSYKGGAVSVRAGSSPVKPDVIDLTSLSNTNPVPRRPSPPSVNLFNRRSLYTEGVQMKTRERDPHADSLKEDQSVKSVNNLGILNQSIYQGHSSQDPNSSMEFQIPLQLLQDLIRRGLITNPAFKENDSSNKHTLKVEAQSEYKVHERSSSESLESPTRSEEPTNLSLQNPLKTNSVRFLQERSVKRLFCSSDAHTETKNLVFSALQASGPLKLTLDKDTPRPSQAKQAPVPTTQKTINLRSCDYSDDSPLALTNKLERKLEKVLVTANNELSEISTSPPVIPKHLKFLLRNFPYRRERSQLFDNVHI